MSRKKKKAVMQNGLPNVTNPKLEAFIVKLKDRYQGIKPPLDSSGRSIPTPYQIERYIRRRNVES